MSRIAGAGLLVQLSALAPSSALAAEPRTEPERFAWVGLARGPLSPAEARTLERRLLDELDGYESFRLVDARGNALDRRLLAADTAIAARLRDEGVEAFLAFDHKRAVARLDQAIAVFEQRLTGLTDYEILKDALLARAEALYQSGEKGAAKASLQSWIALRPKRRPTTETHPKGFVRLYRRAKRELGPVGRIQLECKAPGCRIQLDGEVLGEAPLLATKVRPGKHYVVARWTDGVERTIVRVAPGRETKVLVARDGPSEEARRALLGVVRMKQGLDEARALCRRLASLARAERTLVASVYEDPAGRYLLLAHHDADGDLTAVIRAPLGAKVDDADTDRAVRQAGAALFVDRREGELDLDPKAGARAARGLAALLYLGSGSTEALAASPAPEAPAPPPPTGRLELPPPPPPPAPERDGGVLGAWWFWTAVGAVVAAGAVTAGVLASRGDATTTRLEIDLP